MMVDGCDLKMGACFLQESSARTSVKGGNQETKKQNISRQQQAQPQRRHAVTQCRNSRSLFEFECTK